MGEYLALSDKISMVALDDQVVCFDGAAGFEVLDRYDACHRVQLHARFQLATFYPTFPGNPEEVASTGFQVMFTVVDLHGLGCWSDSCPQDGLVAEFSRIRVLGEYQVSDLDGFDG